MTNENTQKIKLLKLMEMLKTDSSQEHPLTTETICRRLAAFDIKCDRRTVTRDINTLKKFGYDIEVKQVGHEKGYYTNEVNFSTAQLKIIIDAVQAASFIPADKSQELVEMIATLGDSRKEHILTTSLVCFNKSKHNNAEFYANVTVLEEALAGKKKASFVYFDKNENNERVYCKEKERYVVEPMALIYNEDNYYLMCFSAKDDEIANYRVDHMDEVRIEDERVSEKAILPDDIAKYTEQVFKMYNGPAVDITIEFKDKLIDVVLDKFGEDTKIIRTGTDRCVASIKIQVSPVFWGWLFQFVGEMTIVSPEQLREDYKRRAFDAVNM